MACTFKVAPVKENKAHFKSSSLEKCGERVADYWKEKHKDEPELKFEVAVSNHPDLISAGWHQHGLIATVLAAYNKHIPLILSPDDFWLQIALSVGQFLGDDPKMAEKYRNSFVSHEGKKTLTINVEKYGIVPKNPRANGNGWPGAIEEMCGLIKDETSTDIADLMTDAFSTTGAVEQTAMRATLMETMKNYFAYRCVLGCGIPKITLEGSAEDYKSIIDRIDRLLSIFPDFAWYLRRVREVMVKVYESRMGKPDQDWWRRMVVHEREGSGGQMFFSGWLSDLLAFTCSPGKDSQTAPNKRRSSSFDSFNKPSVTLTDFVLDDFLYTLTHYDMKLAAGYIGTALDKEKNALRPAIGWMTFYYKEAPL